MKALAVTLLAVALLSGCGSPDAGSTGEPTAEPAPPASAQLGGCILTQPSGAVPEDLYSETDVVATDEFPPFTKKLSVYGLTLVARDDASDDFMRLVARAIKESFPRDESLDLEKQEEILRNLYRYKSVIPVPVGEDMSFMEEHEATMDRTRSENSICDIIMQDVPRGQVMEVVEHILHYVSDMGLHYTFPDEWGISEGSAIARAMQKAVDAGYYDVTSYADIPDAEARRRVEIQEFAYWIISTAWDLQEPYGPPGGDEWGIRTREELKETLPEFFAVYEQTVGRTMVAPSAATLKEIGPTRSEEPEPTSGEG